MTKARLLLEEISGPVSVRDLSGGPTSPTFLRDQDSILAQFGTDDIAEAIRLLELEAAPYASIWKVSIVSFAAIVGTVWYFFGVRGELAGAVIAVGIGYLILEWHKPDFTRYGYLLELQRVEEEFPERVARLRERQLRNPAHF